MTKRQEAASLYSLLPLRDIIVFPHMVVPLFVGREKSIRALKDSMNDRKQIILAAQKKAQNNNPDEKDRVVKEITKVLSKLKNVVYLHNNVVVIEGVALVGVNGHNANYGIDNLSNKYDDLAYLQKTIEKLQLHIDVKQIIIISSVVPSTGLYFGENSNVDVDEIDLNYVLGSDTEHKVTTWVFGTHKKIVDTTINGINYVNNPMYDTRPYWAKRVEVEI